MPCLLFLCYSVRVNFGSWMGLWFGWTYSVESARRGVSFRLITDVAPVQILAALSVPRLSSQSSFASLDNCERRSSNSDSKYGSLIGDDFSGADGGTHVSLRLGRSNVVAVVRAVCGARADASKVEAVWIESHSAKTLFD